MAGLPNKTFDEYVSDMIAAWAATLGFPPTFQQGDAFYALMQTVAGQLVFIQAQIQLVNAVARAQTSSGADLDTFYAQFGFLRHEGVEAQGPVVFGSFSPAVSQVVIPPGVVVQTQGGAIQYQTVADTTQPSWSAVLNGYVLAPGQSTITATVQALVPGAAYNVTANQLSQIATSIPGIDTVMNAAAITNGSDAESDANYRARFILYINALSRATYGAILSAVTGVPGVTSVSLVENINLAGAQQPGEFIATIDDGSGAPPSSLVSLVQAALEDVRGFTILGIAQAVSRQAVTELITVRTDPAFTQSAVNQAVQQALQNATNTLGIGETLYVSTLESAALAVAGVIAVQPGTLISGLNADKSINQFKRAYVALNDVTVDNY